MSSEFSSFGRTAVALAVLILSSTAQAYNTAGSMLHVDSSKFNHSGLIQLTWTADIYEYDYVPLAPHPFRLRIEFNSVGFMGDAGFCCVGAMIQNVGHSLEDDIVGSNPSTISNFPALGLYFSCLQPAWSNNGYGVDLVANPERYPDFGRVFEDVDGLGTLGKNIYTRQAVSNPPTRVKWTVSKGGVVTNPPGNLAKNAQSNWVSLVGTAVVWEFSVDIDDQQFAVADYYLPLGYAKYIWGWDPLVLHQEYFGAAEGILTAQMGHVRYTHMRAFDATNSYPLNDWKITWRIDDGAGNTEDRFGWKADATSLVSRVGHAEDSTGSFRDVGTEFTLNISTSPPLQSTTLGVLFESNAVALEWPSQVGLYYQVREATNLSRDWSNVGTSIRGTGRPLSAGSWTNAGHRFFGVWDGN